MNAEVKGEQAQQISFQLHNEVEYYEMSIKDNSTNQIIEKISSKRH